jgi:hypothetical protein
MGITKFGYNSLIVQERRKKYESLSRDLKPYCQRGIEVVANANQPLAEGKGGRSKYCGVHSWPRRGDKWSILTADTYLAFLRLGSRVACVGVVFDTQ